MSLEILTNAAGIGAFVLILILAGRWLIKRAIADDLLAPLLAGAGLRVGVMLIAQVAVGSEGTFFLDDEGFIAVGSRIADAWVDGELINPAGIEYAGSVNYGFQTLVAAVFVFTGTSVIAIKLVNVLIGCATILVAAWIGKRLFGEIGQRRTAWAIALLPTAVWWSAVVMKEALVTLLVVTALLMVLIPPRPRSIALLTATAIALVLIRPTALIAVAAGATIVFGTTVVRERGRLDWRKIGAGLAAATALAVGASLVLYAGDPFQAVEQLGDTAGSMFDTYRDGSLTQILIDWPRSLFVPFPWNLDSPIGWDRALIPGVWLLIAILPTAALGVWRLRGRQQALLILLLPIAASTLIYAITAGAQYRQRSAIEPLIILLFVAGVDSWRSVAERAAAAIGLVAVLGALHEGSVLVGVVVALGALVALGGSRLLPADREPAPPGPNI